MKDENKYSAHIKILVLGESGVGKTSLLLRYCEDDYSNNHLPTIGVDFKIKSISIKDKKYKLQIWDTAGQERFQKITKTYYRSSNGVILTYDITDINSFNKLRHWIKEIDEAAPENVIKILVGNKCDVENSLRQVSIEDGQKIATKNGMKFYESSAKTKYNVNEAFNDLAKNIAESNEINSVNKKKGFGINSKIETKKKSKCCN